MRPTHIKKVIEKYPIRVYNEHTRTGYLRNKYNTEQSEGENMDNKAAQEKNKCCEKMTMRPDEERRSLINRLNRIEGQIRGIRGMVENNCYCNDILIQSAAVNAAVNAFNRELISSHIKGCVVRDIENGDYEVIDELVTTLQKLMK